MKKKFTIDLGVFESTLAILFALKMARQPTVCAKSASLYNELMQSVYIQLLLF